MGISCEKKHFLLAVSGGADSMALLELFSQFSAKYGCRVSVATVFHGECPNQPAQEEFREKCVDLVAAESEKRGFVHKALRPQIGKPIGESEEELRDLRWKLLRQCKGELACDEIVVGHHAQDLLETRLIRLIRGTGPNGLSAMSMQDEDILRPFLETNKLEILSWIKKCEIACHEDPSNKNQKYLRNWLREDWLKSLESYRSGANVALARSLDLLAERLKTVSSRTQSGTETTDATSCLLLDRQSYKKFSLPEKKQALADYLYYVQGRSISANQISEVVKRLDTEQKKFEFCVGGLNWQVEQAFVKVVVK